MNYTVVWDDDAERSLTAVWLAAADRNAVARAADALERRLQIDPANVGESRDKGERVTFEKPIGIRFKVVVGRTVRVGVVWTYR